MSPQFGRVVVLAVMTILVGLFAWIYARDRRHRARLWLIGWIAIEVHFAGGTLVSFSLIPGAWGDWNAYSTLLVAAASFFLSVSGACQTARRRAIFWSLLFAPSMAYWTLTVLNVPGPWVYEAILCVVSITGIALAVTYQERPGVVSILCGLVAACAALSAWGTWHDPGYGMDFILFASYAITAWAYWRHYRRFTPGVVLTSASFLAWGLVWPVAELVGALHVNVPGNSVLWDLPKYFVAFGMIVTLFENQTEVLEREVSERKRAEEQAQAANEAKSIFLASMSHEIRTPMNGILGMTDLLLDTSLTQQQREDLNTVRKSADSLLAVINDILDFSKIEAGKLDFEKIAFDPVEIVGDLLSSMSFRAHQKGLEIVHDVRGDVPPELLGDPGRLRQVLVNLVGNAIKFTDEGEVVVTLESRPEGADGALAHFTVCDTGVGIPETMREVIFEPFRQGDDSTHRKFGGTGLGLAISLRLVEKMGGKMWVESGLNGHGSTFHFTARFGLAADGAPRRPAPADGQLRNLAVLVVDDNAATRDALVRMLGRRSIHATAVSNAKEARRVIEERARAGNPLRVVVMDSQMPHSDGFDASAMGLPVILMRSPGMPDDRGGLENQAAAWLNKPVREGQVMEAIHSVVQPASAPRRPAEHHARAVRKTGGPGMHVLIAEDHAVNQVLARRLMEKAGHRVTVARNGREALEAVQADSFDLVLMDVQMPEMDGFEATAAIRRHGEATGQRLPIIAMTAHAMKGDEEKCLAAGMDAYVSKPIDPLKLAEAMESALGISSPGTSGLPALASVLANR